MTAVESDVMIIGGGLAGWRAAEAAVAGGASVTLVANGPGNSPHIHALNCPVLPEDSVEQYIEDTLSSGRYENDRALVEAMCAAAREKGLVFLTLEVRESNLPARRLYERCGFETVGTRKNYYEKPTENAVLMTRSFD